MAGLAADADFRIGSGVLVRRRIVLLAQVGGMAVRAMAVPVLIDGSPVQRALRIACGFRVQGEPALAALVGRAAVPGGAERLQATAWQTQQILLQGVNAEGIAHRIVTLLAVRPRRANHELVAATGERRAVTLRQRRGAEIAQHTVGAGGLHGQLMMGAEPIPVGLGMAAGTGGRANEMRRDFSRAVRRSWRPGSAVAPPASVHHQTDQQQQQDHAHCQQQHIGPPPTVVIRPRGIG